MTHSESARGHGGATLMEIAAAGETSHTTVRKVTMMAFPAIAGRGHRSIPRDLGRLLAVALRNRSLNFPTARLLQSDPAAVLAGAEALAALARRALEEQDTTRGAAA
ncbi:hypothetical protein AB0L75_42455 [Streptomyces sp. NPDC052101]|uniref:hypothetical protein n=1 Tax=Streptomyces sp. NPDC052101 TaxID=3155763 RepID=UPI00343BFE66